MLLFASAAAASFNGGNVTETDLRTLMANVVEANVVSPTSGGTLTLNSVSLGSYDYTVKSGAQTVSSFTASDWFTSTEDTRSALIAVNGNLTINSGQTFIPSVRKLFTCIYVKGNLTLNGSISMSARGSNHSGSGNSGGATTKGAIRLANGTYSAVSNPQVPSDGAAASSNGTDGQTGGGGTGGQNEGTPAAGTSFSGGPGSTADNSAATANGGRGANAIENFPATISNIGGGAGNPGGSEYHGPGGPGSTDGSNGTGGVLIIYCTGTLSGTGSIVANGAAGGTGYTTDYRFKPYGGGGSGGGSITIFYGTDTSSITPAATGGAGGTAINTSEIDNTTYPGNAGGNGTARKLAL
jgi:hypothetical protein